MFVLPAVAVGIFGAVCSAAPPAYSSGTDSNTVRASTGYFTGKINENYTNVRYEIPVLLVLRDQPSIDRTELTGQYREFLDIPYGADTSGSNRFMPPKSVPLSSAHFDATQYAKACPQYVTAVKVR